MIVQVEAYGDSVPLKTVATVSSKTAQSLSVTPHDAGLMNAISVAVRDCGLNLNPQSVSLSPRPILTRLIRCGMCVL